MILRNSCHPKGINLGPARPHIERVAANMTRIVYSVSIVAMVAESIRGERSARAEVPR